ncbi:MAG TPA: S9 family peptidase, partial [Myxococcota bacterium]|nr:S9 family peptidase [Myxococcota bacterium]
MLRITLVLSLLALACASSKTTEPPAVDEPAATRAPDVKEETAQSYSGHGLESVSQAVLEKFAPKAPPADIAKHAQQMVELYGPGAGVLTPDAKRLVFTWRVSGQQQVWRIDGAKRFPVQLTSGEDRTFVEGVTPDGKTLVLSRDVNGEENPGIYLMPVNGGALKAVQHVKGVQTRYHVMSRDGGSLYFTSNDQTKDSYAVYRHVIATGAREVLY